jgi:uncharacterized protein (TIGR03437 family)
MTMKRRWVQLFAVLAALLFLGAIGQAEVLPDGSSGIPGRPYEIPDEMVIKLDKALAAQMNRVGALQGTTGLPALDSVGAKFRAAALKQIFPESKEREYQGRIVELSGWYKVKFAGPVDVSRALEEYLAVPGVLKAQPNGYAYTMKTPNDPSLSSQWHLAKIAAPQAWDIESGDSGTVVAIIDTGVRYFHKDLGGTNASPANPQAAEGNMWINKKEKNGAAGVDDDGNGKVDDWIGRDFVEADSTCTDEDCTGEDNDPRDYNGHGTHCEGIVAAITNNGYGVASPAGGWGNGVQQAKGNGVRIMPIRAGFDSYWGGSLTWEAIAKSYRYAADTGAKIASCSFGGGGDTNSYGGIDEAVDYYLASGGIIFKAAGNSNVETVPDYISNRSEVVNVAATDQQDCKASFSSYGTWVDISAPGVAIFSTFHDKSDPQNDKWVAMDGTSMATPLAASVAALIWSANPGWTADQVKAHLRATADSIDALSCNRSYRGKMSGGRVNAYKAVKDKRVVASSNAASYDASALAPESIVAAFGTGLSDRTEAAQSIPLPTTLAGTTVKIRDRAGEERLAPLFYVSPVQVNYQIPAGTATDQARVVITHPATGTSVGAAPIGRLGPGIFSANADGKEVAAANALRVKADGSQVYEPVTRYDDTQKKFVSVPVDLGPAEERVYLLLYATGLRFNSGLAAVGARIGGVDAPVIYAGAQGYYVGLDQVNVLIPRSLAGRGEVEVLLTVEGKTANAVKINVR